MTILEIRETITRADKKKHFPHRFQVDKKMKQLKVAFSYTPKFIEGKELCHQSIQEHLNGYPDEMRLHMESKIDRFDKLPNMLTFSIDDPNGFRGNVHRHFIEKELIISQGEADYGLVKGPITEGEWTITVSSHGVLSDMVTYELKVEGE